MPAPTSSSNNNAPSGGKRRPNRHGSRAGFPDLFAEGGPPKEVFITRLEDDEEKALNDLMREDDQSAISSLGSGEARAVVGATSSSPTKHVKQMPDLDRVLNDTEETEENVGRGDHNKPIRLESPGLAASRDRYKLQSTPRFSEKTPLIHIAGNNDDSFDEDLHGVEDISLGDHPETGHQHEIRMEVIDVEQLKNSMNGGQKKSTSSDDTSRTASGSDESPGGHSNRYGGPPRPEVNMKNRKRDKGGSSSSHNKHRDNGRSKKTDEYGRKKGSDDEDDKKSTSSENSAQTQELLGRARDRLTIQRLQEEVDDLKQIVSNKNEEIKVLAGQLRRAVETKCDLVLAHTEMEQFHEYILQAKDKEAHKLMKANLATQDKVADVERDLMNEVIHLQQMLKNSEKRHVQELQDWERLHKNEMLERDCEIGRLKNEIQKLNGTIRMSSPTSSTISTGRKNPGKFVPVEYIQC